MVKISTNVAWAILCLACIQCSTAGSIAVKETTTELKRRILADPNDPIARYNLAVGYIAHKQYDSAMTSLDTALIIDPAFVEAHFAEYCVSYALHKAEYDNLSEEKGTKDTSRLVKMIDRHLIQAELYNPFFDWRVSAILLESPPFSSDPGTQRFIDLFYSRILGGFREFTLGNYADAIAKLTQTLELIPDFTQGFLIRGFAYAQLHDYDAAVLDFQKVIDNLSAYNKKKIIPVYVNTAEIKYIEACAYYLKKDYRTAEAIYKEVLTEDFSFYMAHAMMSQLYKDLKQYDAALQEVNAAIQIEPNDPVIHYNKALVLTALRDYKNALQEYYTVIRLNPRNCKPYFNVALILQNDGKDEEAKEYYRKFIETSPLSNVDFIMRARTQLKK